MMNRVIESSSLVNYNFKTSKTQVKFHRQVNHQELMSPHCSTFDNDDDCSESTCKVWCHEVLGECPICQQARVPDRALIEGNGDTGNLRLGVGESCGTLAARHSLLSTSTRQLHRRI